MDLSGDIILTCLYLNWNNVATGTWFPKYLPPVHGLKRTPADVERRRLQQEDPNFAASLHRTMEKKIQEVNNRIKQLRHKPKETKLQSGIASMRIILFQTVW